MQVVGHHLQGHDFDFRVMCCSGPPFLFHALAQF